MWLSSPDRARDDVLLAEQARRPERVDHLVIGVRRADQHRRPTRAERLIVVFVGITSTSAVVMGPFSTVVDLHVLVQVLVAPPPLVALHLDLHRARRDHSESFQISEIAGTITIASSTAGAIVQPISKRVLPVQLLGHPLLALAMPELDRQYRRCRPRRGRRSIPAMASGTHQHVLLGLRGRTGGIEGVLRQVLATGGEQRGEHEKPRRPTRAFLRTLPLIVRIAAPAGRQPAGLYPPGLRAAPDTLAPITRLTWRRCADPRSTGSPRST